jgi:hypothetical protein
MVDRSATANEKRKTMSADLLNISKPTTNNVPSWAFKYANHCHQRQSLDHAFNQRAMVVAY